MSGLSSRKLDLLGDTSELLAGSTESELVLIKRFMLVLRARRTSTSAIGPATIEATEWSDEVLPWLDVATAAHEATGALTYASLWLCQTRSQAPALGTTDQHKEAEEAIDNLLDLLLPVGDQGAVLAALRGGLSEASARHWAVAPSDAETDSLA